MSWGIGSFGDSSGARNGDAAMASGGETAMLLLGNGACIAVNFWNGVRNGWPCPGMTAAAQRAVVAVNSPA